MKTMFNFKLKEHNTTIKTELIAGFTTFLTMVYIVLINPSILAYAGMDAGIVFVATCLIAAVGSIGMGLFANLPIALAPAMGLNAFFAYIVVGKLGYSWQVGMASVFWAAFGLFLLTLFRIRYWLISNFPLSLRVGITAGIGFFIALMGFKNSGLVVASPATLVTLGNLHSTPVLLSILGLFIMLVLAARHIHAAVLISIVITTVIAWLLGEVTYQGFFSLPPSINQVIGEIDFKGALDWGLAGVIFSFLLVNLFDSSGTLLGVTDKAGIADEQGKFPKMKQALYVDCLSSMAGAYIGTSSVTAYVESSSGVSVGGRTGLTAITTGVLFLLVMFVSPLVFMIPTYATAGALIYVGILMVSVLVKVDWKDLTEAAPAFITTVTMPFTYSITEGIAFGFISYVLLKLCSGKWQQISLSAWLVAILFLIKMIFID